METNELVFKRGNQLLTTSLKVADIFERRHSYVTRRIESIIDSLNEPVDGSQSFIKTQYGGKDAYDMTRNGFNFLSMMFVGKRFAEKKAMFAKAFGREPFVERRNGEKPKTEDAMAPISTFSMGDAEINIYGSVEKPLFKAKDVADVLDVKNYRDMYSRIDDEEKDEVGIPDTIGRVQQTACLTEDGLYEACFQSRSKAAKDFKKVVKNILKELRTKGVVDMRNEPKSEAEALLDSVKLLVEQERRLKNVEKRLDQIEDERQMNGMILLAIDKSDAKPIPELPLRDKIREIVNAYSSSHNVSQQDVYHRIYHELYYRYKINVNSHDKKGGESKIAMLERLGVLDKVYNIVCSITQS